MIPQERQYLKDISPTYPTYPHYLPQHNDRIQDGKLSMAGKNSAT